MIEDPFEVFKRETSTGWYDVKLFLLMILIGSIIMTIGVAAGTYFGGLLLK